MEVLLFVSEFRLQPQVILNEVKDLTRKVDTSFRVRSFTSFRMTDSIGWNRSPKSSTVSLYGFPAALCELRG